MIHLVCLNRRERSVTEIGLDTQKKLDRLARDFPPLHEEGEPFASYQAYALAPRPHGLGMSPEQWALHEEAGRARTPGLFELPKLKVVGRPPKEEEEDNVAISHIVPANQLSSDSQERIVRRLKRDHEAEYEALQRGEYPSPRAAGIAAGFVKVESPLTTLKRAWGKASQDERAAFFKWDRC